MMQRLREKYMACFDECPRELQAAMRECPFDLYLTRSPKFLVIENVMRRVKEVRTAEDALRFNLDFGPYRRGFGSTLLLAID